MNKKFVYFNKRTEDYKIARTFLSTYIKDKKYKLLYVGYLKKEIENILLTKLEKI